MNNYDLTVTESTALIMIYEGKTIQDIAKWRNVPMQVFDSMVRHIMDKTASKTWEELKIIGAQLAQIAGGKEMLSNMQVVSDDRVQEIVMKYYLTKEELASIEYLAIKWQHVPETNR